MLQRKRKFWISLAIGFVFFGSVATTVDSPGVTWDESIYVGRAINISVWFTDELFSEPFTKSLSAPVMTKVWWSHDHPPLVHFVMATCLTVLFPIWGKAGIISAIRLSGALFFSLLGIFIFHFMADRFDEKTGIFASLSLLLMPRVFGHAHFATLDVPMAFMWFLVVTAFVKGIESKLWSLLTGVFFGFALLTKINAAFIPIVLIPWGLIFHGKKSVPNILAICFIAPLVFFVGWPGLWFNSWQRLGHYILDKANFALLRDIFGDIKITRTTIPTYYFGKSYGSPSAPWHYPLIMTLITVPPGILVPAGLWLIANLKKIKTNPIVALFALNIVVILAIMALPWIPKYDGIRLFMPVFPFIACFAGLGLKWAWDKLDAYYTSLRAHASITHKSVIISAIAILFFASLGLPILFFHPYYLSYYNIFVGGLKGAEKLGMETTYWGDTLDAKALTFVNKNCRGKRVAFFPIGSFVTKTHQDITGDLRRDISIGNFENGDYDYLVLIPRQGMFTKEAWRIFRNQMPTWKNKRQGVPLCLIYRKQQPITQFR